MAFDSFNYDIIKRMPEWYKEDKFIKPVNEYTQTLLADILEGLLTNTGVVQPLNCWLTIPEEYTWYHHYKPADKLLVYDEYSFSENSTTTLIPNKTTKAILPNTKRPCHAKIKLKLLGTEVKESNRLYESENIEEFIIENAGQQIIINNIPSISTIEISTEDNEILIDDEYRDDLVTGSFEKIRPVIKNSDYEESYIDENQQEQTKKIDLEDENKKTEIILKTTTKVDFDLQIYLYKPTYTTEQNIRVSTISAFPIENIKLYGYFCHPFNNQSGYKLLWQKNYSLKSRTTYDRITKQYDCERFYIEVKFHGIGKPLYKGFPQENESLNKIFQPNPNLDKWGKIYGLKRRIYRNDITEDEEPYTFPKYYPYPIEQDYWYEERMVHEYRYDNEAIDSLFVRDTDFNNIGMLECIYPFTNDIWVYTETIDPNEGKSSSKETSFSSQTTLLHQIKQEDEPLRAKWENIENFPNKPLIITLEPKSDETFEKGKFTYQSNKLLCSFCLREINEEVPKDITIKGIELKFKTESSVQSNRIKLDESSTITIPYLSEILDEPVLEKINIFEENLFTKKKGYFIVGSPTNLFGEKEITREQLFYGNDGKVDFELIFSNENTFLESIIYIKDISLNIYFEKNQQDYDINVSFDKKEINLSEQENEVLMNITIENKSQTKIRDKNLFIIIPPELKFGTGYENYNSIKFNLDVNEKIDDISIPIMPKKQITGWYDILVFCEDKVITNEILIKKWGNVNE